MRSISIAFCVFVVLLSVNIAQATIIHVPAEQTTIQAGINASVNGDTVLVAPGTYYEHINFIGKAILVKSEAGAKNTIIEKANEGQSIVTFSSGEDSNSIIDGFSVRNAVTNQNTGAVMCDNSSPRIKNCIITANSWPVPGGGIGLYCTSSSSAIIEFCSIVENSGVGISLSAYSHTRIENNLVSHNLSIGISMGSVSDPIIKNNTIIRNSGNGIRMNSACSPDIINTIVALNGGCGISSDQSYPAITYSDVWNNYNGDYCGTAPGTGCISADPIFCDSASDNYYLSNLSLCVRAGEGGADIGAFGIGCGIGVFVSPGNNQQGRAVTDVLVEFYVKNLGTDDTFNLDITDSLGWTIVPTHFSAPLDSGETDTVSFIVSIPYVTIGTKDKLTLVAVSQSDSSHYDTASLFVYCNQFAEGLEITKEGNTSGYADSMVSVAFWVKNTGVIPDSYSVDISDSLAWSIQPLNYKLTLSPGQKDSVTFDVTIPFCPVGTQDKISLSGISLTNPNISTSAYLYVTCNARIIHVPAKFSKIQSAINFSADYDSILVAPGTYQEHINFLGKRVVVKSEMGRDSTTISQVVDGISIVSFISGEDSNSVLDGFTIADGNLDIGSGAGIKCQSSSPKILNCRIVNNVSPLGAGIDCDNYSSPLIAYNLIEQNHANSDGGGIRCGNHSSPLIYNNTIVKNSAVKGGGMFIDNTSTATIVNNIVTSNLSGRGIRAEGPLPTIIYCDVWSNLDENYYGCLPGEGCISADPVFCNPNSDDYSLWISSPCLGSGQNGSNIGTFGIGCSVIGDANGDGTIDVGDIVYLINYLFKSGPAPSPLPAGDATCDGNVDVGDVVYLINYLFKSGPPPSC